MPSKLNVTWYHCKFRAHAFCVALKQNRANRKFCRKKELSNLSILYSLILSYDFIIIISITPKTNLVNEQKKKKKKSLEHVANLYYLHSISYTMIFFNVYNIYAIQVPI